MPSTRRSRLGESPGGGGEEDAAQLLEDAAEELSSEIAAHKAAEERVAALEAQLAEQTEAVAESDRALSLRRLAARRCHPRYC